MRLLGEQTKTILSAACRIIRRNDGRAIRWTIATSVPGQNRYVVLLADDPATVAPARHPITEERCIMTGH